MKKEKKIDIRKIRKALEEGVEERIVPTINEMFNKELSGIGTVEEFKRSPIEKTVDEDGNTVYRMRVSATVRRPKEEDPEEKHRETVREQRFLRSIMNSRNSRCPMYYDDKINEFEDMLIDAGWTLTDEVEGCYVTYSRDEGEEITLFNNMFDISSGIIETGAYYEDLDLHPCEDEKIIAIGPINCTLYREEDEDDDDEEDE